MNYSSMRSLKSYLGELERRYNIEKRRRNMLQGYEKKRLKLNKDKYGNGYYLIYNPGEQSYRYLGKDNHPEVLKIKEAHYLSRSARELEREAKLIRSILKESRSICYEDINASLHKVYRDAPVPGKLPTNEKAREWKQKMENYKASFEPYRPEELIHKTRDGTLVRSLGEALIYNHLLELGVTFVYELPLRIHVGSKSGLLLPDFTILTDAETEQVIYIEHQGKMNDPKYRNKFNETVYKYWSNGYLPERDVYFTFNLPNGGFDDTPIGNIIRNNVRLE